MNTIVDVTRAYHFAAVKHVSQRRKGEAAEPYTNHLTEVAELVAKATNGEDIDVTIAAIVQRTPSTVFRQDFSSRGEPAQYDVEFGFDKPSAIVSLAVQRSQAGAPNCCKVNMIDENTIRAPSVRSILRNSPRSMPRLMIPIEDSKHAINDMMSVKAGKLGEIAGFRNNELEQYGAVAEAQESADSANNET